MHRLCFFARFLDFFAFVGIFDFFTFDGFFVFFNRFGFFGGSRCDFFENGLCGFVLFGFFFLDFLYALLRLLRGLHGLVIVNGLCNKVFALFLFQNVGDCLILFGQRVVILVDGLSGGVVVIVVNEFAFTKILSSCC